MVRPVLDMDRQVVLHHAILTTTGTVGGRTRGGIPVDDGGGRKLVTGNNATPSSDEKNGNDGADRGTDVGKTDRVGNNNSGYGCGLSKACSDLVYCLARNSGEVADNLPIGKVGGHDNWKDFEWGVKRKC